MQTTLNNLDWALMRHIEIAIADRLGRNLLLDNLSITEIEQINSMLKPGMASDEQLSRAINEMID